MPRSQLKAQASAPGAQERARGLDWGHLRFFLELVRTGSHARAAKRLSVDRNTVARRVVALEEELGVALFERGPQGWSCTAAGQELSELASRVEQDVLALARHADAQDRAIAGTVRLTTTTHLASSLVVPALPRLRETHPGIVLEVSADQRSFDLTRREADLALRMGRPLNAGLGLVTRKLAEVAHRLYAGEGSAAARRGAVDPDADDFIGFDDSLQGTPQERWLAKFAPDRRVVFRCNSTASLLAAARLGVGVALLPCFVADRQPSLVPLEGAEPMFHELWLLVHGDLRRTPRVKAVIEWVDELIAAAKPELCAR
jgi:DNA-binding transcriptional LysR family regulator